MTARIILFGATGYTGQLVATSMARRALADVTLVGRDLSETRELASVLNEQHSWEASAATADLTNPVTVNALIRSSTDIVVNTVGPFRRYGKSVLEAVTAEGAIYLDSAGEPTFTHRVFHKYGPRAARTGATLLTGFGYEFVPGNLAGLLALRQARHTAGQTPVDRLEIGYFVTTDQATTRSLSEGARASVLSSMSEASFAWHDGAITRQYPGQYLRTFRVAGSERTALSIGGTEHYSMPKLEPSLRHVNVYLGWGGKRTQQISTLRGIVNPVTRVPWVSRMTARATEQLMGTRGGNPSAQDRRETHTLVIAQAYAAGERIATATVTGPNPYNLTADLLALGAHSAAQDGLGTGTRRRAGALGAIEAFSETQFLRGCTSIGLVGQVS